MDFAKAIRVGRAARGVSQQELAKRAGVSASYISLIEGGKREPTIASTRKLAEALEIPVDLVMLLAIESTDQTKVKGSLVEDLAEKLLALLIENKKNENNG